MRSWAIWTSSLVLFAAQAHAQDAQNELSAPAPETQPAATSPCPLQATYEAAFDLYADHDYSGAITALERVVGECPDLGGAQDLLRHAHARQRASAPRWSQPATRDYVIMPPPPSSNSDLARVELTIAQGLFGIYHGIWICEWATTSSFGLGSGCSAPAAAGAALLGAAIGAGATVALSLEGLTEGQATVIEAGTFFGNLLGLSIWAAAGSPGTRFMDDRALALPAPLLGHAIGTGAGALLAIFSRPSSGQVALTSSSGLWASALGGFLSLGIAMSREFSNYDGWMFGASQLIAVPLGLVAGAVASFYYQTSRGRMFLVDLGTALSGGLGALFALLSNADNNRYVQHLGFWEAVMIPAGFAITMALTGLLDVPADVAEHVHIVPGTMGGPGLGVLVSL